MASDVPGEDVLHPEQDRGIAGPVSTIQLANFRRGLQDHLYLTLACQLGLDSLIKELCRQLCRACSLTLRQVGFAETGNEYERGVSDGAGNSATQESQYVTPDKYVARAVLSGVARRAPGADEIHTMKALSKE